MQAYELFKHPERGYAAVKRGFSWPGFFFTVLWAFSRQLWMAGLALGIGMAGLGLLAWQASQGNPYIVAAITLIFQLVAGFKGNYWRGRNLQARGYNFIGAISARNAQAAVAQITTTGGIVPVELKPRSGHRRSFPIPATCQRILAIIGLTWKAALRDRLFWVLATLLLVAVVGLPLLLKDDGTAEGLTQILLTYTLSSVTCLLGVCTLWLACGTLARDIEECQMQMVVVKPIARWQIWLGKWLGLLSIDAVLLALAGLCIYGMLEWRAQRLPASEQAQLRQEVLVARDSAGPKDLTPIIEQETDHIFQERVSKEGLGGLDPEIARKQLYTQVQAQFEVVPPDGGRRWVIHLGAAKDHLKDQPLSLRVKFNSSEIAALETYRALWQIGVPQKTALWRSEVMSLAPDTFHEFPIPPNLFDDKGDLTIEFANPNLAALSFPLGEGIEVLYPAGSFEVNFIRGLCVIFCWMALFATLGLATASFLSFPVAAFCSVALLIIGLFSGTMSDVVKEGSVLGMNEGAQASHSVIDQVVVPMFRGMLTVIELVKSFSPIEMLSTGRSITWTELGLAVSQIVLLMSGVLAACGIFVFSRRELATAQGTQ